jgi:hypothetical protein
LEENAKKKIRTFTVFPRFFPFPSLSTRPLFAFRKIHERKFRKQHDERDSEKNPKKKHNPNESILYTQFDYSNRVRPKLENP